MLEDAVATELPGDVHWAVDGQVTVGMESTFAEAMACAEEAGGLNYGQWKVVQCPPERKTSSFVPAPEPGKQKQWPNEWSSSSPHNNQRRTGRPKQGNSPPSTLIVTYTREAALQMRARLARTLMLRQRLCRYCVPPGCRLDAST